MDPIADVQRPPYPPFLALLRSSNWLKLAIQL